jgi:SAM-dependent methyltransferase
MSLMDQRPYWDGAADQKTFTHPIPPLWLDHVKPDSRLLDFGCGYGRLARELLTRGFTSVTGVDFSPAMIARARAETPQFQFEVIESLPLRFGEGEFDAVLLFAVLTCVPESRDQAAVVSEIRRLLRPGGLLLMSDLPLQPGRRDAERYQQDFERFGVYGTFETSDGAVVRHHDEHRWDELLEGFTQVERREVEITSMNGSPCRAVQILAEKRSL